MMPSMDVRGRRCGGGGRSREEHEVQSLLQIVDNDHGARVRILKSVELGGGAAEGDGGVGKLDENLGEFETLEAS